MALLTEPERVLIVNAGSSSLKVSVLLRDGRTQASADLPPVAESESQQGLRRFVSENSPVDAVGHRVVHGGPVFRDSVIVTDTVLDRLASLSDLAPLHNPPALAALEQTIDLLPQVPQVACFDTAFHATLPDRATTYAIPWEWTERLGVRRYGFHGFSHRYAARRGAEIVGRRMEELRMVTCHLGAGASLAAVAGGTAVDTTMGFTPLEGLVMATRSGSVDPGALLWIQRRIGHSAAQMEETLERSSGLLGISGVSADMREVLQAADQNHHRAQLAVDVYLHRLRAGIAAMVAATGGIDVLVFTGGVGEKSSRIRSGACEGLAFLGVALDRNRNESVGGDRDLSSTDASVRTLLVHAREDLEIAAEVRQILAGP